MKSRTTIRFIVMVVLTCLSIPAIKAQEISKEVKVAKFHKLDLATVGTVYFIQDKECSVKIEGKEKNVELYNIYVEDHTLCIEAKEKNINGNKNGVTIYITAPSLSELDFMGVGQLYSNEELKADVFKCTLQGVGKMYIRNLICRKLDVEIDGIGKAEIRVKCQELEAGVNGIGSLTLSGSTEEANISKSGIGRVDTDDLKIGK